MLLCHLLPMHAFLCRGVCFPSPLPHSRVSDPAASWLTRLQMQGHAVRQWGCQFRTSAIGSEYSSFVWQHPQMICIRCLKSINEWSYSLCRQWIALWVNTEAKFRIILNIFISVLQCPFGSQTGAFQLILSLFSHEAASSTLGRDGYIWLFCPLQPLFNTGRIHPGEKRQDSAKGSAEREVEIWSKASARTLKQWEREWVSRAAHGGEGYFLLQVYYFASVLSRILTVLQQWKMSFKTLNYFTKVKMVFPSFFNDNWSIVPIFCPNQKIYFPHCHKLLSIFL